MDIETIKSLKKNIMRDIHFAFIESANRNGLLTTEQFANKYNLTINATQIACKTGRIECFRLRGRYLIPMKFRYKKYQRRKKVPSLVDEYRLK